ncbi:MAG TPA: lmo0937 family membrane protein [Burkholderiaceae bacterium]|nr:lmo0937 family membrane protein [Burkholderiaceae bacterium]
MYRIAVSLFMLWLLGVVYSYTMDGYIHALPVIALVIALTHYLRKRPAH